MTTSQQDFLTEILDGPEIPLGKIAYFRARLRNRLYDLVVSEFLRQTSANNLSKADLARRIHRRPEQVTRWLSAPSNWTLDTLSDLLLAMGAEPESLVSRLADRIVGTPKSKQTAQVALLVPAPAQPSPLGGDQAAEVNLTQPLHRGLSRSFASYGEQASQAQ